MRELGYVEGRDFDMTYGMADFHADRCPKLQRSSCNSLQTSLWQGQRSKPWPQQKRPPQLSNRISTQLLTLDEAPRIVANIARLPLCAKIRDRPESGTPRPSADAKYRGAHITSRPNGKTTLQSGCLATGAFPH
jgi:hypothetical protein